MAEGRYVKIYQSIVDDPMFERVYTNDHAFAVWVRMLMLADVIYPIRPPMPSRNPTVRLLIEVGLVVERPLNTYSVRGLEAERERQSEQGRRAANMRWHSGRTARAMPPEPKTEPERDISGSQPEKDISGSQQAGRGPAPATNGKPSAIWTCAKLTKRDPSNNIVQWVRELELKFGTDRVIEAMELVWKRERRYNGFIKRVELFLEDPGPQSGRTSERLDALKRASDRPVQ